MSERTIKVDDRPWKEPWFAFHGIGMSMQGPAMAILVNDIDSFEYEAAQQAMCDGDRVIVAGNGLGSISMMLGAQFGRDSVIGYEPHPTLFEFCSWFCRFKDGPPRLYNGALGTEDGHRDFHIASRWAESSLVPERLKGINQTYTGQVVKVPLVDTNRVIREHGANALLLDTEGAEHEILPYLDFEPLRWLVVEIHGHWDQAAELRDLLRQKGMEIYYAKFHVPNQLQIVGARKP